MILDWEGDPPKILTSICAGELAEAGKDEYVARMLALYPEKTVPEAEEAYEWLQRVKRAYFARLRGEGA